MERVIGVVFLCFVFAALAQNINGCCAVILTLIKVNDSISI